MRKHLQTADLLNLSILCAGIIKDLLDNVWGVGMKQIIGVVTVAFLCSAQAPADNAVHEISIFGIGSGSCANWLASPDSEYEGSAWLLGYWSGVNAATNINHNVGKNSDGPAIVADTKLICQREPSTRLDEAVGRIYYQFQESGK